MGYCKYHFSNFRSSENRPVEITNWRKRPNRFSMLEDDFDTAGMPTELRDDNKMHKYWKKRHSLFHRFDEGIKLDRESWFSVTPEKVAWHIANKYKYDIVLDAFCGAGGNTIQFAHTSKKVIAIDIDPQKIAMARHNAKVYGVADRIHFIVGDFFELAHTLKADMVFLSPPWGGPSYSEYHGYDLETMLLPKAASELMRVARNISSNITFYLPRNSRLDQILSLAEEVEGSVEIERSYLDKRFVAITGYYSNYKFDEGIKLDRESWFSVTPEKVAWHIANKYKYDIVLDAFCGAGGNTIQFAHTSKKVIAIDNDPQKIAMARHNAKVYGVADRIQFIVGDFFELAHTLNADMVFLSPPWGGPSYSEYHEYDLETMLKPKAASELMRVIRKISSKITFYLLRNSRLDQILSLAEEVEGSVEIERSYLDKRFVAITGYYSNYK